MGLRQDASNLQGDVVRHVDHGAGAELPAEAAGPEILIVSGLQQCHGDLDLVSGCADAALQHIVDMRNGGAEYRPGAGTRSEVAAEDEHVLETDHPADHVLGDAFGKAVQRRVAAVVGKRLYHQRWGMSGGCPPVRQNPRLEYESLFADGACRPVLTGMLL